MDFFSGNYTLELARYELGNVVWKSLVLQTKFSEQESKLMMKAIKHILNTMEVLGIASSEEEILETAKKLKITFYDAGYVHVAEAKQMQLITEDARLIKKVSPTINAATLDDIR